ncbi:MAG: aldo/keto reductase [Thermoguttaceae bacterium]|jgi:aryl-alcohol dehydrogenase-like predicted oxidoreductase
MHDGLKKYVTLGRSGLRVSPLCLGTMTFGTEWDWGTDEEISRSVFNCYIEAGGNFLDTADVYTNGTSEKMLGEFIAQRNLRDNVVLATKFTINSTPGDPNSRGNGRKNMYRALEGSLRRLKTDYIDLYWMHFWDTVTPVEEVVATFNDLVCEGKIRYYGFSDIPAWYAARAQTLAEKEGKHRLIALQMEYSLVERSIEREHIPAAQELGIGICPWSPLASGFLSGKYKPEGGSGRGEGRLEIEKASGKGIFERFTQRNWLILEVLLDAAKQMGKKPAQVALNWVKTQPGITSVIIGATKPTQLDENLAALEFTIPDEHRKRLDEVGGLELIHPYVYFGPPFQTRFSGGVSVRRWKPAEAFGGP